MLPERGIVAVMGRKVRTELIAIFSNAAILTFKLLAGIVTGSVSIVSEAVHSASDLVTSCVALIAVWRSEEPPDRNHHYGHGRIENLGGVVVGFMLFGAGVWVISAAVRRILHGGEIAYVGAGIGVMAASAVINLFVARWLLKVGRETDSRAIEADGYHLLTDVWSAAGVALGLVAVWLTGWTVLDPIIAAAIGLLILWTALRLMSQGFRVLLDESLPEREMDLLGRIIEEQSRLEPRIRGFHKLRARKSGPHRHIDFHLQLEPETPVREAHLISDTLEEKIRENLPNSDVLIHLEDDRSLRRTR
jgi:cation diffusion facilitator family transporter